MAAEDRQNARLDDVAATAPSKAPPGSDDSPTPRRRLVFRRRAQPRGWWLWGFLSGGGGGKARRRSTPKGVLHQIAGETPSFSAAPTANLALEIIRRTLGIEAVDGVGNEHGERARGGAPSGGRRHGGSKEPVPPAPLTWNLIEAAFEPISEDGAGHEATGLSTRLDPGGMHAHALYLLARVRALEERGLLMGIRVPVNVEALVRAVKEMEARRIAARADVERR